jgi:hypothetical protein
MARKPRKSRKNDDVPPGVPKPGAAGFFSFGGGPIFGAKELSAARFYDTHAVNVDALNAGRIGQVEARGSSETNVPGGFSYLEVGSIVFELGPADEPRPKRRRRRKGGS